MHFELVKSLVYTMITLITPDCILFISIMAAIMLIFCTIRPLYFLQLYSAYFLAQKSYVKWSSSTFSIIYSKVIGCMTFCTLYDWCIVYIRGRPNIFALRAQFFWHLTFYLFIIYADALLAALKRYSPIKSRSMQTLTVIPRGCIMHLVV